MRGDVATVPQVECAGCWETFQPDDFLAAAYLGKTAAVVSVDEIRAMACVRGWRAGRNKVTLCPSCNPKDKEPA